MVDFYALNEVAEAANVLLRFDQATDREGSDQTGAFQSTELMTAFDNLRKVLKKWGYLEE